MPDTLIILALFHCRNSLWMLVWRNTSTICNPRSQAAIKPKLSLRSNSLKIISF